MIYGNFSVTKELRFYIFFIKAFLLVYDSFTGDFVVTFPKVF
jgi:hypothetical protein